MKHDKSYQTLLPRTRYWNQSVLGLVGSGNETNSAAEEYLYVMHTIAQFPPCVAYSGRLLSDPSHLAKCPFHLELCELHHNLELKILYIPPYNFASTSHLR